MNEQIHLASLIDHTFLKPEAVRSDIEKLCDEARRHGFYSVCVNGTWVPLCRERLAGSDVRIAAVCGFPLGAGASSAKAFEAARAVEDGASEIDMVLQIGRLLDGDVKAVEADIAQVVRMVEGKAIVKVILETGMLTTGQKIEACKASEAAGAHFVKTSTGFGRGGATVEDIRLMRGNVSPHIGVKASGGVRDTATALAMIEAGATRIGTSSGIAIVTGAGPTASDSTAGAPGQSSQY
ncbi:deoxyribose-phosphate aldolase [Paenibacillus melissococcoides]|uniref:Deoxyribose-phosphate aldolase n=1 Tax=Paenibacillus melissococcoides TaxID=2912268 RepID=A0ABN8U279_9BACL|nr:MULTISPECIES: deoxyribose-phosphate aldolase [Paenibacillus]MEB9896255.1 deoxyribose-phosphate aldolase [Bacillus cereus]CAH8245166.1 deoxyribose-phosphate aldolase [Paenibacillus melissococcoides]CAH8710166.1 deoxyribose-phosphate aldolase [Paenibacillus melissococcoides]CAH8710935.1 deoxyribose-phosphate aldolase [Paenibacillus melissococcoides]GIO79773.1 deoxyribose-phosphate aldolase [Paenibacillus dendritiformis]